MRNSSGRHIFTPNKMKLQVPYLAATAKLTASFLAFISIFLSSGNINASQAYAISTEDFSNPERGFHEQTHAYVLPHTTSTPYTPLNQNNHITEFGGLAARRITVVHRLISLKNFSANDTLPAIFLDNIRNDLNQARALGIKLYMRFAYDFEGSEPSVPLARVISHIQQLGPVLTQHSDVITHLDAGMLGKWGEWYAGWPEPPGIDSIRAQVIQAWLAALPADRSIALRKPIYKQRFLGSDVALGSGFDGSPASRIGHHNDCFVGSVADKGTYEEWDFNLRTRQRQYVRDENRFVPQSGETCQNFVQYTWEQCGPGENCQNLSACPNATAQVQWQRWSLLNTRWFDQLVKPGIGQWHFGPDACYQNIKQRLGYRIELLRSNIPSVASVGSCGWNASVTLRNVGSAAPFNPRGLKIVMQPVSGAPFFVNLLQPGSITHDPRRWLPDSSEITISLGSQLPNQLTPGSYRMYLFLPDGRASLENIPAYSIRTANTGLWDAARGWNDLNHTLTVTACANYTVGGSISGLAATRSVVLRNSVTGENLTRSANGAYAFSTAQTTGATYNVTVQTQPVGQICSVTGGVGTIGSSNVSNVNVTCVDNAYTMVVSSPSVARGATANATVQLGGPGVAGATFRLCVDGSRLTPGTASVPAGLPGLSCAPTSSGCPAGTTTGWLCNGFAPSGTWTLPQTITLPLTAGAGATLGTTPLTFGSGTAMSDGAGNNLTVTSTNGTVTITGTLSVGGTLSGLTTGQSVVLRNTVTSENLSRNANGAFTFATPQANGASYNVIVQTQPNGQSCSVTNGSGTLSGNNVGNITVSCAAAGHTLSVSAPSAAPGSTSTASVLLTGPGVAGAQFRLCVDGTRVSIGTPMVAPGLSGVSCNAQTAGNCPAGTTVGVSCAGFSASGTWTFPQTISVPLAVTAGAPIGNTPLSFTGVTYADNDGNKLPVSVSGGTMNVTSTYTVGGTISGLGSGLSVVLRNTVTGENLTRNVNGVYAFTTGQTTGTNFNVTVQAQPAGQICTVANGNGTIGTTNVSNVNVSCVTTSAFTVGGTINGLAAGRSIVLRNTVTGENLTRSANGSYAFTTAQATGANYNVTVQTQPSGQACTVANGTGTVGTSNVSTVNVNCPAPSVLTTTPALGTTLDFGPVVFGEFREVNVQVGNGVAAGGMPLVLSSCSVSGNAALSRVDGLNFPQTIQPGSSITLRVRLAASAALSNPVTGTLSCAQQTTGESPVLTCSESDCTNSTHTLSITAPSSAPGGTSTASVVLAGPGVAGAQFRLCVDDNRVTIGSPVVPSGLGGVICMAQTSVNCPAGTTVGVSCSGFSASGTWTFPQTISVPLTVAAGAPLGSTPLIFTGVTYADNDANKLPVTVSNGSLNILLNASSWPLTGRAVPQQVFANGFEN